VYTVFRIATAADGMAHDLAQLIDAIDTRGSCGEMEPRRGSDGYAVALCNEPSWAEHSAAIVRFLEKNRDALARVRAHDAWLAVDVAVEPGDGRDAPWLSLVLSDNLMDALVSVGVRFAFSVYLTAP
jgi:hypothetical protein